MFQLHLQGLVRKCNTFCIYISSVCVSLHNLSVSLLTMEPYTIWKVSTIKDHLWTDMVFPVVTYICESWTIKKAVSQRVDAFELWCWRRLLRAPWTAKRSGQSMLRELNPSSCWKNWCWIWNSSILVMLCEQPTHWKSPWCWERLRAGEEGVREWDGWMSSPM